MSEGSPPPESPGTRHPWDDLGGVGSWVPWGSTPSTPRNSMPSQPRSPADPASVDSAKDAEGSSARAFNRVLSGAANLSETDRSMVRTASAAAAASSSSSSSSSPQFDPPCLTPQQPWGATETPCHNASQVSAHSSFATTGLVATLLGRQDDRWFLQQQQSRQTTDSTEHSSFYNSYLSESQALAASPSSRDRSNATAAAAQPDQAAAQRDVSGTCDTSHRGADEAAGIPGSSRRRPLRQPWDDVPLICSRSEPSDEAKAPQAHPKETQTDTGGTASPEQKDIFVPTSSASSVQDHEGQAGKAPAGTTGSLGPKGRTEAPSQPRSQKPILFDSPYDAVAHRANGSTSEWSLQEDSFASGGSIHSRMRGNATTVPRHDGKVPPKQEMSGTPPSDPRDSFLAASAAAAAAAASGRRRLSASASSVSVSEWDQSTLGRSLTESTRGAAAADESFSSLTAAPWSPEMSLAPRQHHHQQQHPWSPRTPPPPSSSSRLPPYVPRRASLPASAPPASTLSRTSAGTCFSAGTQREFAAILAREIARELEQEEQTVHQMPGMGGRDSSPCRGSDVPEPYVPGMAMRKFREAISSGDSSQTLRGAKRSGLDLIIDIVGKQKHSEKGKKKTPKKKAKAKTPPPAPPIGATKGLVAGVQGGATSRFSLRCNPRQKSFTRWVFAKDVTAYKAVAAAVTATGDPLYLSIFDGRTCYPLGKEAQDTGMGMYVFMSPTEALGEPILSKRKDIVDRFPRLVLKVMVSGRGYQMGNKFAFPFLRPVSVLYPDEIIGRPATDMIPPVFGEAMENADQGNVLQTLRDLSFTEQ